MANLAPIPNAATSLRAVQWTLGLSRSELFELLGTDSLAPAAQSGRISPALQITLREELGIPTWMLFLGEDEVLALGLHLEIPEILSLTPEQEREILSGFRQTGRLTRRKLTAFSDLMNGLGLTPSQTYVAAIGLAHGGSAGANTLLHLYEMMYDD